MAKSNGSVIGVWLDAMKSGLELWHEFTAHGRIKTMDEVRRIEYVYSMNMQSEIGRIRDAVQLIGHNDEIGFKMELSEAMKHPILGRKMSEMIDKLVELLLLFELRVAVDQQRGVFAIGEASLVQRL